MIYTIKRNTLHYRDTVKGSQKQGGSLDKKKKKRRNTKIRKDIKKRKS